MSAHHSGVSWCLWLQRSQGGHHIARGEAGRRRGCSRQRGQPLQKLRREHKAASWGPQPRGRKAGIDPPAWGGRFKGGRALHGLRSVLSGAKDTHGLCWGRAGTEEGTSVWVLETRQVCEAGAPGELLGRSVASASPGAHPHLRGAPSCMPPGPAGALWPLCGWDGPATSESCFCAAARAPVSLTLDPASYLSNSKRNSAAAEGKKITSAAELGGKTPSLASAGPTPVPGTPHPCAQPSLGPQTEPRLSRELGASLCPQRYVCVCVWCLEGLGPPPYLRLLAGWGPRGSSQGRSLPLGYLGPDRGLSLSPCPATAGGGSRGAVPSIFWNASLPFLSPQTCS